MEGFSREVQDGLPIEYACDMFGITRPTYLNWMNWGERDINTGEETIYAEFFTRVKKAYALFVRECKNSIRSGKPGWQGTAWWLERTNTFFMPKQQIQADDDGKVTVVIGGKPKDPAKRPNKADS